MEPAPRNLPFSTSFQFREDESAALEALFARTFFDRPYTAEAREALQRTLFPGGSRATAPSGEKKPVQPPPSRGLSGAKEPPPRLESLASRPTSGVPGDHPRYVLLYRGASGIGKTRIFRQFREIARKKEIPVYEVYHHDVEGIPFKPFLHAIREILRDHDRGAELQEKYRYGLEPVFPELYLPTGKEEGSPEAPPAEDGEAADAKAEPARAGPACPATLGPASRVDVPQNDVRILDAITQLLLEVTARKPLLILVHDLHSSDRPTIELLGYIGRNLQIRNTRPPPSAPDALFSGPEMDDFENEEWRSLARKSGPASEILGGDGAGDPGHLVRASLPPAGMFEPGGPASGTRGPRLMVLGNYRGFTENTHYLEQALRSLGQESFAYHGELTALDREEAARFIRKSLEPRDPEAPRLELSEDAGDAIFEATEGFPSFMHELFSAMHLREGAFGAAAEPGEPWTAERIRSALAAAPPPPSAGGAENGAARGPLEEESIPTGLRHSILSLRLANASPEELKVLQVLAVARRPLTCELISKVVEEKSAPGDADAAAERVAADLSRLEERGLIERHESNRGGADRPETSYFFRLWDYTMLAAATIDPDSRKLLHQRIGEELRGRLESDEEAYEVYYHLRRGLEARSSVPYGLMAASRFVRSFALQKARYVLESLGGLVADAGDTDLLIDILEQKARIGIALKESEAAEETLRDAQAKAASLPAERRIELIFLEAEAARAKDPGRGLKILGKVSKLLADETSRLGVRLQLATARMRLERADIKRAINFGLKGVSIAQKVGDLPELGELYRVIARAFYRKGDYTHAVDNYQRALDAFDRLNLPVASVDALDEVGRVYLERGNYFRAARYLYKSLEIRRSQQDIAGLCRSYDELGRVYHRSGDYLKTIENLNRSLALKERIGDFAALNPTLVILGDLYFRLGRHEQALFYFKREVENSQKLGDTKGIVESFVQLGRVYCELGDIKQAESLAKQVSILSTEFKLKSREADGVLLEGNLKALARDWAEAEKSLKTAADLHEKLGHRRRAASAYLDLADVKVARELYDEALKLASKGQLIAEEVKALDLQVRSLTVKGNIYRHLKGGNIEKVRECLQKALELAQSVGDVSTLFQLFYSLAKVSHSEREFAEAANYYTKAELILKQIAEGLSEDRAARFFEDRRRKVFAEDIARFRKEVLGRGTTTSVDLREPGLAAPGAKDRPMATSDYKDLVARILRVHSELGQLHFHDRLLAEALDLTGADRGFVLRVQNRQYIPVAVQGFGKTPSEHPEFATASALAQEAIRKGRSVLTAANGGERPAKVADVKLEVGGIVNRSILAVPVMTDERIFGGIYLDKPEAVGQLLARNQALLESFAQHAAVALNNRREFETAIREPITGFYTPSYFVERLREAYRWYNLHGKAFAVIGFYLPSLENALIDGRGHIAAGFARDLSEILPPRAVLCWGAPILYVLLGEEDLTIADELAEKARAQLSEGLKEEVASEVLPVHNRYQHGSEIYLEMRRRLLPEVYDRKILSELRSILANDISLRDAKMILEKHKIERTLKKTGGNITHAARELGIHRPQLSNLLKKYALKREVFESNGEDEEDHRTSPSEN